MPARWLWPVMVVAAMLAVEARSLVRMPLGHREAPLRRRLDASSTTAAPLFQGYGTHFAYVYVGSPPQRVSVIVDTGSHITAFPCQRCHECGTHTDPYFDDSKSSTYEKVSCSGEHQQCFAGATCQGGACKLHQSYAEGSSWSALQATDLFWIGGEHLEDPGAQALAVRFPFGCQSSETGLFITQLADGIMGMDMNDATLMSALVTSEMLPEYSFSLCFRLGGGILTLGGTDEEVHLETMAYTPLKKASGWYTVQLDQLDIGDTTVETDADAYNAAKGMIVDSGTTDTYLPKKVAGAFKDAWHSVTGRKYTNEAFSMTQDEMLQLPILRFHLEDGVEVEMPPTSYLELQSDGKYISRIYLDEAQGGVLGANFMREHDVHFDKVHMLVGFARSTCTYADLPTDEAQDCTLSDDWYPTSPCDAACDEHPDETALEGMQNFTKIVTAVARDGGAPCPDPQPTKEDTCVRDCTNPEETPPTLPPSPEAPAACDPQPGWSTCRADCTQSRELNEDAPSGAGCKAETRDCHTGECRSARGYQMDLVLLFTGVSFGGWDRDVEDDVEDAVASVLGFDAGDAAVSFASPVEECASQSIVQVTVSVVAVADPAHLSDAAAKPSVARLDDLAFASIREADTLVSQEDFHDVVTAALRATPQLDRITSARVLVNKVIGVGGAALPQERSQSGGHGLDGGMIAITVFAVLTAVLVLILACVHHQKLRFRMRQQGRHMLARIRPHLDRHTYEKLSKKDGEDDFIFDEDAEFEDGTITDEELDLART